MSEDAIYLRQILDAIAAIEAYAAVGEDRFFAEPLHQDGIILQLINIDEATSVSPPISGHAIRKSLGEAWRRHGTCSSTTTQASTAP